MPFLYLEDYLKRGVFPEYQNKSIGGGPINSGTWLYRGYEHLTGLKVHVMEQHSSSVQREVTT